MDTSPSHNPIVILNPTANRGNMQQHRALIRHRVEQEPQGEYVETTRQGEAQELARKAAEEGRAVIIVGGDGCVHEVVKGMLSSGRLVSRGLVAAGSGNDDGWNTLT